MKKTITLLGLILISIITNAATIYVDIDATGSANGTSWANAYTNLQDAIDNATGSDEIWVAEGRYIATRKNGSATTTLLDKSNSFYIDIDGIELYGGFEGTETSKNERDVLNNVTILDADLDQDGDPSDNAYHAMLLYAQTNNITNSTVIDGFTFTQGKGVNSGHYSGGQGINCYGIATGTSPKSCAPIIRNCTFTKNHGYASGSLRVTSDNSASDRVLVENCIFTYNTCLKDGAGINLAVGDKADIINCTFYKNNGQDCGAIYGGTSGAKITNCIFWNNYTGYPTHTLINDGSTYEGSATITYCMFDKQSSYNTATGNIEGSDPLFTNPDVGDFSLQYNSPAIDAGSSTAAPATDFEGLARPVGTTDDMGALEFRTIFVNHAATGGTYNGQSWATAYQDLQDALDAGATGNNGNKINIAEGTYKPTDNPITSSTDNRDKAFHFNSKDLIISGGWDASTGTQTGAATILSGDIDAAGSNDCYHVLLLSDVTSATTISNLTIEKGIADQGGFVQYDGNYFYDYNGAGIAARGCDAKLEQLAVNNNTGGGLWASYSDFSIVNCEFSNNNSDHGSNGNGGAIYSSGSNLTISNCDFSGNQCKLNGGALYIYNSTCKINNCIFDGNDALPGSSSSSYGGAVYNSISNNTFNNCLFNENFAKTEAGAVFSYACSPTFNNCTFIKNGCKANGGAGAINIATSGTQTINNCVFFKDYHNNSTSNLNSVRKRTGTTISGTNNASGIGTTCKSNVGSGFVDLSAKTYAQLFNNNSNPDGANSIWLDSDDGFVPQNGGTPSVLIGAGSSSVATVADATGKARAASPSIGAYEVQVICESSNALPTTASTTYTGSYKSTDANGWTHYCSSGDKLLLSLKIGSSGAVINADEVKLKTGSSTTYSYLGSDAGMIETGDKGYVMIDRRWNVSPTTQPSSNVGVKYYFTEDEYDDLDDALLIHGTAGAWKSTLTDEIDVNLFKATLNLAGTAADPFSDPHTVNGIVIANGATPSTTVWKHSTHGTADHTAEFEVSSFSGGGGGGGGGGGTGPGPLPVELINFTAKPLPAHNAKLDWATASEINNSHFIAERSYDGLTFEPIGTIGGNGNSNEVISYEYLDNTIATNQTIVYYRLNQFDYDGANEYSDVRKVDFGSDLDLDLINVYPNPFTNTLTLTLDNVEQIANIQLTDLQGKVVYNATAEKSINTLDLSQLSNGIYILNIQQGATTKHLKVTKN